VSILEDGDFYEPCNVYLQVVKISPDGNVQTCRSTTPTPAVARFDKQGQSGTSARRAETDSEGFTTEDVYRVRFPRSFDEEYGELGAQAAIGWGLDAKGREAIWPIFGNVARHNRSERTRRAVYVIRRS
jgi:hypothetical protein